MNQKKSDGLKIEKHYLTEQLHLFLKFPHKDYLNEMQAFFLSDIK